MSKELKALLADKFPEKFKKFTDYLNFANNGRLDLDGYLESSYGTELLNRLKIRFETEDDPAKAGEYYRSIGLKKEIFEWDDYYTRWTLLSPLDIDENRRYPLLFWNHGGSNSIECEECMTGFAQIAASEGFMLALLQNTNGENVLRVLELIKKAYPVDTERVFIGGFSQGASQAQGTYHHHPELFAGCVTSGNDILRPWDNFDNVYTPEELEKLTSLCVPLIQFMGVCEPSMYAPLNNWAPRVFLKDRPKGDSDTFVHPGKSADADPTRIKVIPPVEGKPSWRMSKNHNPEEGTDIPAWCMEQTNWRMRLLGCEERDAEKCIGYLQLPDEDLHKRVGIYGDYEAIEVHYGYKHYTVGVSNKAGVEVYRAVVVENSPHWPQIAMGRLAWDFLKRFSRNADTGELVING